MPLANELHKDLKILRISDWMMNVKPVDMLEEKYETFFGGMMVMASLMINHPEYGKAIHDEALSRIDMPELALVAKMIINTFPIERTSM